MPFAFRLVFFCRTLCGLGPGFCHSEATGPSHAYNFEQGRNLGGGWKLGLQTWVQILSYKFICCVTLSTRLLSFMLWIIQGPCTQVDATTKSNMQLELLSPSRRFPVFKVPQGSVDHRCLSHAWLKGKGVMCLLWLGSANEIIQNHPRKPGSLPSRIWVPGLGELKLQKASGNYSPRLNLKLTWEQQ